MNEEFKLSRDKNEDCEEKEPGFDRKAPDVGTKAPDSEENEIPKPLRSGFPTIGNCIFESYYGLVLVILNII